MTGPHTFGATFAVGTFTLTVSKSGIGGAGAGTVMSGVTGIDCGADCAEVYEQGANVRLVAAPDAVSAFVGWSGVTCPGVGDCLFIMDADRNIIVRFALKGDVNGSGALDLADVILALQISAGIKPGDTLYRASLGSAGRIGIEEVIYIL